MQWNPSLSVGDVRIDEQHQRLFRLLESLEITSAEDSKATAQAAVSSLQKYVQEHLRDEEAVMRSFKYKDYDAHCAIHHEFEVRLASLAGQLSTQDPAEVLRNLKVFVSTWLFNHISVVDQLYKPFLLG
jgi:hemerythrin-like metal-binding protein